MAGPVSATVNYDNISSVTESVLIPEIKDVIFDANPLLKMLDQKKTRKSGGTFIKVPLMYGQSNFGFHDGRSGVNIAESEKFTNSLYNWKWASTGDSVSAADEAINNGEIIEDYPDDKYGPSCLIFGMTAKQRPLHIQCSYPTRPLLKVITVYEPDPAEWIEFRERK